jgi:PKD repeat protein/Zn-dependent protease
MQNPVHTYRVAGNYTISLTVANVAGNTTRIVADYVIAETVKADFTANVTSGKFPLAVKFTDKSINGPASWNWSFGDDDISDVQHPVHTYTTSGWYNVTLVANNTYGSGLKVKTQYINIAAGGTSNSTDIPGISMVVAPSWTQEPVLNRSAMSGNLTISGNDATLTNPSLSFSSIVFHFSGLTYVNGNVTGALQSVQMTTAPLLATLGSIGPTEVFVAFDLGRYAPGNTISILMSEAPSASDATAFATAAGTTKPLQSLSYEMDITTTASDLNYADIYFTVPLTWSNTYGSDNIRLFHIHDSPYCVSVLPVSLYSTSSTTATYRATTTTFSRFSPGAISPASSPASPSSPSSPSVYSGGDTSDTGGGPVIEAPKDKPKEVMVPKAEPPKEIPLQVEPEIQQEKPAVPAVIKADVLAPVAPGASPETGASFPDTVISSLQEGGARAAGFVTGERGTMPADAFIPPIARPLGAVATGVAMAGAIALAGSAGTTASGGLLGTIIGRILTFFQHLFKPVSDLLGDRLAGHAEDHAAKLLERKNSSLSRSLDASRNTLLPGNSYILILIAGAALYGIAFVVAERAGMVPEVIGTYIVVSGLVVALHELVHHTVARHFAMKSEINFSFPGLIMTFFTAWFFGNVFSQPLTTKIPEETGLDRKARGVTMFSGPLMSLACAAVFALLIPVGGIWTMIGTTGVSINLVQGVYSLIPVKPLDGQPVFTWNRVAWAAVFIPVFAIYLLIYLL